MLDGVALRFVARPVSKPEGAPAALVMVAVGAPTRDLDIAPQGILASMLLVSPIILLFAIGVGYVLSARALQPLGRMIDELEAITDGRSLHRRLPAPPEAGDEIAIVDGNYPAATDARRVSPPATTASTAA